jgi:hypothetical protein
LWHAVAIVPLETRAATGADKKDTKPHFYFNTKQKSREFEVIFGCKLLIAINN